MYTLISYWENAGTVDRICYWFRFYRKSRALLHMDGKRGRFIGSYPTSDEDLPVFMPQDALVKVYQHRQFLRRAGGLRALSISSGCVVAASRQRRTTTVQRSVYCGFLFGILLCLMAHNCSVQPPKLKVLIVDDHELVRDGIARILEDRWDICGQASNGVEAIEKVQELRPDLVILDLSMPVMSGIEAAKAIRATAPKTKIIFLSMHDSPTVAELVRIVGADGFISKHCHAEGFRETIAALLSSA